MLDPNGVSLDLASPIQTGDVTYGVVIPQGTSLQHAGTWTLEITDGVKNRKRGTLYDWSLIVNPTTPLHTEGAAAATAAADGGGRMTRTSVS